MTNYTENRVLPSTSATADNCQTATPTTSLSPDENYCESTFDGFLCWGQTKAGERAYLPCPFNTKAFAFKDCLPNGTWFRHPISNISWTNYTQCFTDQQPETVMSVFTSGYAVSIITLIISMIIFNSFRQLDCARVSIHKNLFLTYILNGIVWIIEYKAIVTEGQVLLENPIWCQAVHVMTQYTTCSNYFWMFCEGLFMNTVIVQTFSTTFYLRNICYIIGWVVPLLPTTIYTVLRTLYGDNKKCWTGSSDLQWIIQGPITVSLLVSLALGANILRILISKLRDGNTDHYQQTSRGVRATLILIPLLGLHYFIMPLRPEEGQETEYIYNIISAILISFQGFFVSVLFCFLNEEVIAVIRRKIEQMQLEHGHLDTRRPSNALTLVESTSFSTRGRSSSAPGSPKQNGIETEAMLQSIS